MQNTLSNAFTLEWNTKIQFKFLPWQNVLSCLLCTTHSISCQVTTVNLDNHRLGKIANMEQLVNLKWASFNNNDLTKIEVSENLVYCQFANQLARKSYPLLVSLFFACFCSVTSSLVYYFPYVFRVLIVASTLKSSQLKTTVLANLTVKTKCIFFREGGSFPADSYWTVRS